MTEQFSIIQLGLLEGLTRDLLLLTWRKSFLSFVHGKKKGIKCNLFLSLEQTIITFTLLFSLWSVSLNCWNGFPFGGTENGGNKFCQFLFYVLVLQFLASRSKFKLRVWVEKTSQEIKNVRPLFPDDKISAWKNALKQSPHFYVSWMGRKNRLIREKELSDFQWYTWNTQRDTHFEWIKMWTIVIWGNIKRKEKGMMLESVRGKEKGIMLESDILTL